MSCWGMLKASQTSFMRSLPGVLGAGDAVRDANLAVWAMRDGHAAAEQTHNWLNQCPAEVSFQAAAA